ncbi:DNA (cytosine-5-)-methyltransferase [Enorma phocaeensis]|uniref:Cytosine-specific methyltransferase n=1 Tax=Enorma phocaeensis TaxID=1871019 RepID=A0ABT7V7N5_9ACTN|nr:DNA (cytosine-5-)-methyltransferase [Enorma phocaeensis]MBM6952931.1 DNA (cytosine-5-)-methyltransferase [Enorma phocaeensis]MDM8274498.1 DNA (cytosine-5-)-methyltransferase [Enorma phocaeensis]
MSSVIRVAELFAGVGGFRLGLDGYHDPDHPEFEMPPAGPFKTVWANQWEPGTDRRQFAARCYKARFGMDSVVNEDIHAVLDEYEAGDIDIPDVDMVVGGFPCQDYSVARTLSQASGIEGKKGVLWWDIYRFLRLKPDTTYCLFENVDRLLKSPASQRGRDFAIILSCLSSLGYAVEWRVVNSAEYGFPQRRKRVYIYAEKTDESWSHVERLTQGIMAEAFPIQEVLSCDEFDLLGSPADNSDSFGVGCKTSPFRSAGIMQGGHVTTAEVVELYQGSRATLGDVLVSDDEVPEEYYVSEDKIADWKYLKGAKREPRKNKRTGFEYMYTEGAMAFPDALDRPSRTILTGEGGVSPSRFKHVIETPDGRLRRLVPDELDQLQCFPKGWTDTGMTDGQRAFCMGNALVTGIPHRIGLAMARRLAD